MKKGQSNQAIPHFEKGQKSKQFPHFEKGQKSKQFPHFEKGGIGGIYYNMLKYKSTLKHNARRLRKEMTDSEKKLWSRLRGKQIMAIQFYRQKPIGPYIVDFYAPTAKIVVEVDGSQHMEERAEQKDMQRDDYLKDQNLFILRFNNLQVLQELDSVVEVIYQTVKERM
ncbi:MAG: DUF559 domain-containing protein [Candidatus Omnitrophota bacterium]